MMFCAIVSSAYANKWVDVGDMPDASNFMALGNISAYDTNHYMYSMRISILGSDFSMKEGIRIIRTTDYGTTWDIVYSNVVILAEAWKSNTPPVLQYVGKDSLYAFNVLEEGLGCFYKTFDNGNSWDTSHVRLVYGLKAMSEMYFKNPDEGIIYMRSDTIVHTADGGNTWSAKKLPSFDSGGYTIVSISGRSDTLMLIANRRNTLFKKIFYSTDFGKNWEVIDDDLDTASSWGFKGTFRNKNEWWISGQKNPDEELQTFLKKTTDQGETWQIIDDEVFLGVGKEIYFFPESQYLHFRTLATTYSSTDNGITWTKDEGRPENNFQAYDAAFPSFTKGLLLDAIGKKIWRYETSTSVKHSSPTEIKLYPNPAKDEFTLDFFAENAANAKIYISDVLGNNMAVLYEDFISAGSNSFTFSLPENAVSGSYYITLEFAGAKHTEALQIVK